MDDLLDQLGRSKFFTTLDLASGYWQVKVHPHSREKTAFITPQGLYEFKVMPFGLRNAPAVFQRLMKCVLAGLNPPSGPDFVPVYLDDVIIFSRTLNDHLQHLSLMIDRLVSSSSPPSATSSQREYSTWGTYSLLKGFTQTKIVLKLCGITLHSHQLNESDSFWAWPRTTDVS